MAFPRRCAVQQGFGARPDDHFVHAYERTRHIFQLVLRVGSRGSDRPGLEHIMHEGGKGTQGLQ